VGGFQACKVQAEKLRGTLAAEACKTLQFDFSSVSSKLRAGKYDSVEEACADVEELGHQAAQSWGGSEEQVGPCDC
jgi:hypothetical protein